MCGGRVEGGARTNAAAGRVDVDAGRKDVDAGAGVAESVVALRVAVMGGVELGGQVAAGHADRLPHICCMGTPPVLPASSATAPLLPFMTFRIAASRIHADLVILQGKQVSLLPWNACSLYFYYSLVSSV